MLVFFEQLTSGSWTTLEDLCKVTPIITLPPPPPSSRLFVTPVASISSHLIDNLGHPNWLKKIICGNAGSARSKL